MCPGPFELSVYKLYVVLYAPGNRLYEAHYDLLPAREWHKGMLCQCYIFYLLTGSHIMHIHHNFCTVHWFVRPPPKVVYQPNCECGVPFMTKEMLHGIGLPLHVPLPHALWMMPHGWVCCVMACVWSCSPTTLIKECF